MQHVRSEIDLAKKEITFQEKNGMFSHYADLTSFTKRELKTFRQWCRRYSNRNEIEEYYDEFIDENGKRVGFFSRPE